MPKHLPGLLAGFACVPASWALGTLSTAYLHLPLPSAVIGLVILFGAFVLFPSLVAVVAPAGRHLLGNFPLFLYPLGAGFLALAALDFWVFIKIAIAIITSLVASMTVCALVFRWLKRDRA